eukprot:1154147-Pelagomonas_calceolata.AAC.3
MQTCGLQGKGPRKVQSAQHQQEVAMNAWQVCAGWWPAGQGKANGHIVTQGKAGPSTWPVMRNAGMWPARQGKRPCSDAHGSASGRGGHECLAGVRRPSTRCTATWPARRQNGKVHDNNSASGGVSTNVQQHVCRPNKHCAGVWPSRQQYW